MVMRLQVLAWSALAVCALCFCESIAADTPNPKHDAKGSNNKPKKGKPGEQTKDAHDRFAKGDKEWREEKSHEKHEKQTEGPTSTAATTTSTSKPTSTSTTSGTFPVVTTSSAGSPTTMSAKGNGVKAVTTTGGTRGPAAEHHAWAALEAILNELHKANYLLHDGEHVAHHERARAEAEIEKAIQLLREHHEAQHKPVTSTASIKSTTTATKYSPMQSITATEHKLHTAEERLHESEHLVKEVLAKLQPMEREHHHIQEAAHFLHEASHAIEAAIHATKHLEKEIAAVD
jgi:hypothetical protein